MIGGISMDKSKNILGIELKDNEKISEETLKELSDGKGDDDE
ncbi:MAG: hypothetical protein PHG06_21225 [Parabacteroides sp.]|nr:hypothetical protein [Parabacteroides sp.]